MEIKSFGRGGLRRTARGAGAVAAAILCLLVAPAPAQAASVGPTDGQLNAAQRAANVAGQQVGEINAQIALAQAAVSRTRAAANIALGRYEDREAAYEGAAAAAQRAADEAAAARAAEGEARAQVGVFARSSYIQGSTSAGYAAALTADGPRQMLERNALLAAANGHQTDVLGRMAAAADQAATATRAAATARDGAATLRQQAQTDLTAASDLETAARRDADALQKQQVVLQAALDAAQENLLGLRRAHALAVAYQQQQAAAAAREAAYSAGGPAVAAVGNNGRTPATRTAIAAALSYVGQMYAWGGGSLTGPTQGFGPDVGVVGFDCSGLTRYAYAQAGITIPRVAADQYAVLPSVSSLEPGDLVFYATDPSDAATVHHVAMFLGDGLMIEAPESGERVHVTAMRYGYEYIGAVRPTA